MKTKKIYICEICNDEFEREEDALECESRPTSQEKVKVGDMVRITQGQGAGNLVKVKNIGFFPESWGGQRYWHTMYVQTTDRLLDFDSYEAAKEYVYLNVFAEDGRPEEMAFPCSKEDIGWWIRRKNNLAETADLKFARKRITEHASYDEAAKEYGDAVEQFQEN